MKRQMDKPVHINDFIFDEFGPVDKIILDAQVELALFNKRGLETGDTVRIIELRLQALKKDNNRIK